MTSVETQVSVTDPEGIVGVIRSLYSQLQELQEFNKSLIQDRQDLVQTSEDIGTRLSERVTDLLNTAESMERVISEDSAAITSTDTELQDLLNEKERLEAKTGGQLHKLTDKDIANEERITGFVEEELSRKIEELSFLQDRLENAQKEYKCEWDGLQSDILQYEAEKSKYEETVNHLEELQLAKLVGAHSGPESSGGYNLIKRIVSHHLNQVTYRELQRQVTGLRLKETNLEHEIGDLIKEKQQLWKRCLDLESCLEEIQDTADDTNMLRPAPAFSNLPDVSENKFPTSETSDIDLTEEVTHGRMLHKCHKNTHLVVDLSAEDRTEIEATVDADVGPTGTDHVTHFQETEEPTTSAADDNESEPEEENKDDDSANQQEQVQENTVEAPKTQNIVTTTTTVTPLADLTHAMGHADENTTFINKLRKRVGLGGRSSSSQRLKNAAPKIEASGSMKHFSPANFLKRKR